MRPTVRLALAATLVAAASVASPAGATALPLIESYSPGGHPQYWAVAQDARGVLYFGSGHGVLEHAGGGWRLYVLPRRGTVRSLATDREGTLFVGSQGDFGTMALAADGTRAFTSLLPRVPADDRAFGDVWKTYVTPQGVYFQANARLFRWRDGELRVWRPAAGYHFSYVVDGSLYVLEQQAGLLRMAGDELEPVPGGTRLAGDRLYAMLPLGGGRTLVATRRQGLFVMTPQGIEPFASSAAEYLAEHQVYHGAVLPDGALALGTLTGGLAVLGREGELLQVLDRSSGLLSNKVAYAFVDREQALWLAQEGAIARLEVHSPLTVLGLADGPETMVLSLRQSADRLYVGTGTALQVLSLAVPPRAARLEPVPGIASQVFDLAATADGVLAATAGGVFAVRGGVATAIAPGISNAALASRWHPGRYFVGQTDGLRVVEREGAGWRDRGLAPGIAADVRTIWERDDGGLWLGTKAHGLYRAEPAAGDELPSAGPLVAGELPEGSIDVRGFHGRPVFLSDRGIHLWDARRDRFPLASWSDPVLQGRRPVLLETDAKGRAYLSMNPGAGGGRSGDVLAILAGEPPRPSPLTPVADRLAGWAPIAVVTDSAGIAWLGTRRGLVRLDPRVPPPPRPPAYLPLCRLESAAVDPDHPRDAGHDGHALGLRQRSRSVQVECELPSWLAGTENAFRFALDGVDEEWSPWQPGGSRLYAELPYGSLRLRAQARDGHGRVSEVAAVPLEIVPPWYRTSPAYATLALLATAGLWSGVRLREKRLEARRRQLERLVDERTRELRQSERNYRDLFENASDVIFALDGEGRVESLNPAIEELGIPRAALLGRPLLDFVRPDDHAKVRRWFGRRDAVDTTPVELTLAHGESGRTVEVKVRPLGEPFVTRVEGVARDVSERRARLDAALSRARLRALQSQLQPHFLFNCLNGVAGLVGHDDERARQMLAELGDLLRFSLHDDASQEVPLWQELAVLGKYVALQQSRFGSRLQVAVDAPSGLADYAVPRFVLQPLVENSVKHGVEQVRRPVTVRVTLRREDGNLRLAVRDDGPGFPPAARPGVGLANLRERLRALYGSRQSLQVRTPAGGGSEVEVVLPARYHARGRQVVQP